MDDVTFGRLVCRLLVCRSTDGDAVRQTAETPLFVQSSHSDVGPAVPARRLQRPLHLRLDVSYDLDHNEAECRNKTAANLVLPATVFAEILVGPHRRGKRAGSKVEGVCRRLRQQVEPRDTNIATHAAILRSRHKSSKLPDALVLATGGIPVSAPGPRRTQRSQFL